jgi:hypothetical protein
MNKLEKFSLYSALKFDEISVNPCFYPNLHENYISISFDNEKFYKHWNEVIRLILPYLEKQEIKILLIGNCKDSLSNVVDKKNLSFNQNCYLTSKSLCHISECDHFTYISNSFDVPNFCLFPKDFSQFCWPRYKGDYLECNNNHIDISTSNIASKILNILGIDHGLNNIDNIYSGNLSNQDVIEVIPDFDPAPNFFPKSSLNIRADLSFDENKILNFCNQRVASIITDKPFSNEFINLARHGNLRFCVNMKDSLDQDFTFVETLKYYNVPYELYVDNEDILKDVRLKYIDETIFYYPKKTKKDIDNSIEFCDNTKMFSSKRLFSKNGEFCSKAHWVTGQQSSGELESIIDASDLWEDQDFFFFYKTS